MTRAWRISMQARTGSTWFASTLKMSTMRVMQGLTPKEPWRRNMLPSTRRSPRMLSRPFEPRMRRNAPKAATSPEIRNAIDDGYKISWTAPELRRQEGVPDVDPKLGPPQLLGEDRKDRPIQ